MNSSDHETAISVQNLSFAYGDKTVLFDQSFNIPKNQITAFIGPSGCGKSTLLRCFNRINDLIETAQVLNGRILIDNVNIYDAQIDVIALRRKVGMVFQKYNPFPRSIFENAAYGLEVAGLRNKRELAEKVEQSLRAASLWDEVKDRLHESALGLSGGQQQRLCIARTLAVEPEIILMDEPCAALDPIATAKIEELMQTLREQYTLVIVTHNMQQATRCSDRTAFFYMGKLIEYASTDEIFHAPKVAQTEEYITGRFS